MRSLMISVILLSALPSFGEDIFDMAETYNSKKKKVFSLENKKRGMLSEVYSLERKTRKIVEEKSELGSKKIKLEISLRKTSKKIIEIEEEVKELTPQLQKRLSYVHKIQDMPWMYAFISSADIAELDRVVNSLENINNQEAKLTLNYFSKIESLKKKKNELKKIASEMVELNKVIGQKEKDIKQQHYKKQGILKRIEASISENKKELKKIKHKGKSLLASSEFKNLGILFGTEFYDKKGKLPHPVDTPIEHFYGLNKDLISDNVELMHKGLFYKSKLGSSVQAIDSGKVKHAGFIEGLGMVLVVDHGGRYYSVYANLKKIKVKLDAIVKAKQVLATTGDSSLQFGEGLYFEIRHFSEPENPEKWLKNRNDNQIAGI